MKTCNTCGISKQQTNYCKSKANNDGLQRKCKECSKAASKQWRKDNLERAREYDARYYAANPGYKAARAGTRPADKPWPSSQCGYHAAHKRVRDVRGHARRYECIKCSAEAQHWAYQHGSPRELVGLSGAGTYSPYSPEPDDYSPMCVPCHRLYDNEMNGVKNGALAHMT